MGMPAPSTSFVGRKAELSALAAALDGGARTITLRGAPGVGKTRVAIEGVRLLLARTRLAAAFVDLTTARDASALAALTAVALERDVGGGEPDAQLGRIGAALRDRDRFVLVLDNAEHLIAIVRDAIERWREMAPRTVIVVTSRERLAIDDERVIEIDPLPIPEPDAPLASLAKNDAVALFVERAKLVRPTSPIEGEELRSVAQLVARLDGLPLAIELACSRTGVVSPREMLALTSHTLDVLVARGGRRSLRAAIEDSWTTLSEAERALMQRLALFRGGFTLAAVTTLVQGPSTDAAVRALDAIESLVDKSLVHAYSPPGAPTERRFRLLESIAELAMEKLEGSRDAATRDHERAVLTAVAPYVASRKPSAPALAALMREEANLLSALESAVAAGRHETSLHALVALGRIYVKRGPGTRYLALAAKAAAAMDAAPAELVAQACLWRGHVETSVGRYADAASSYARARTLVDSIGDRSTMAFVVTKQALMDHFTGAPARARERCQEALTLAGFARDEDRISVLEGVGLVRLRESDTANARPVLEEALALARSLGDKTVEGRVLGYLGWCAFDVGQLGSARTHLELAIDALTEAGDVRSRAAYLGDIGLVLAELGLFDDARARLCESLAEHERLGDRWHHAERLGTLGFLALELGQLEEARERFRGACKLHAETRDDASAALHYAGLAVCAAESSQPQEAARLFDEARRMSESEARPPAREAIEALALHLALDEARRDASRSGPTEAIKTVEAIASRARARLAEHPHTEVRPALRLLVRDATALARRLEGGAHRSTAVQVASDGSAVTLGGARTEVRRGTERRVLLALAEARVHAAGAPVSIDALFAAGWGDESASPAAKANRVRVALSALRKAALRGVIETRSGGYRVDPSVVVEIG
jgi:predicted ATPase